MKQQNEIEKLLSLIFQSGGQVVVKDGQLLVGPVALAQKFGDQIKKLKPEMMVALGHCPVCGRELTAKVEDRSPLGEEGKQTRHHLHCSGREPWHFDKWSF